MNNKQITSYKLENISGDISIVHLELNWIENINFVAAKIDSNWYVTDFKYPANR